MYLYIHNIFIYKYGRKTTCLVIAILVKLCICRRYLTMTVRRYLAQNNCRKSVCRIVITSYSRGAS